MGSSGIKQRQAFKELRAMLYCPQKNPFGDSHLFPQKAKNPLPYGLRVFHIR